MGNDGGLPISLAILFGGVILGALIMVGLIVMAIFSFYETNPSL